MSIYLINNIVVPLDSELDFRREALRAMHCKGSDLQAVSIYRKSVDARKKDHIQLNYTIAATLKEGITLPQSVKYRLLKEEKPGFTPGVEPLQHRPVIIGLGPAGMFCGLVLARNGYRPIILEQGAPMEERVADVETFWKEQILNERSNIQFGEGGAGTFSDGKLMTRINDGFCRTVLEEFVAHGAPEEILTAAKPHIGTDLLRKVVVAIRQEILKWGGEVLFHTAAEDITVQNGKVFSVIAAEKEIPCDCLIIAPGNAARMLFSCCLERGVDLEAKPFSVGARIEHSQEMIDRALYGKNAGHPKLGHAEYQLSEREADTGRAVYTFCMCPGGVVVPAASEQETIVTNGMSYHSRAGKNANAALVVSVDPRDFGSGPLDGAWFQQAIERRAYAAVGNYQAPAQTVGQFVDGRPGVSWGNVEPSYSIGVKPSDFTRILPPFVIDQMKKGLMTFEHRIKGYASADAVLTAPETRTSSPVRILRGEDRQSTSVEGIYPCGEGSGYAGGIMSSAVDGIRTAGAVIGRFRQPSAGDGID